jgi:hypothetical protein
MMNQYFVEYKHDGKFNSILCNMDALNRLLQCEEICVILIKEDS